MTPTHYYRCVLLLCSIQICLAESADIKPDESCSCPFNRTKLDMYNRFPVMGGFPFMATFNLTGLTPCTEYCIQAWENYGTDIIGGMGSVVFTNSK